MEQWCHLRYRFRLAIALPLQAASTAYGAMARVARFAFALRGRSLLASARRSATLRLWLWIRPPHWIIVYQLVGSILVLGVVHLAILSIDAR